MTLRTIGAVLITKTRLEILAALATAPDGAAVNIVDLPRKANGFIHGPSTWRPMADAGFIEEAPGACFTITNIGRRVLATARKVSQSC